MPPRRSPTGSRSRAIVATLTLIAAFAACSTTAYQAKFARPSQPHDIDATAPYLKCHMQDGRVYVLRHWDVNIPAGEVTGEGLLYDAARVTTGVSAQRVPLQDVVLFETNRPETITRYGFGVLAFVTGVSLVATALCIANPKACFGSCPTFYATDGERDVLQAEGFSASVARAFEATDVDALWLAHPKGRAFDVRMTNEALETHMVDRVRLLAAPRAHGERVLRAGDVYYPTQSLDPPRTCESPLGSCLAEVLKADDREYLSPASAEDLTEHETIDLTFAGRRGRLGLMIAARNSLLNTFVFYQGLAYMGSHAGDWFAQLDGASSGTNDRASRFSGFSEQLGVIDVSVETTHGWQKAGAFSEVGPIAREVELVVLPDDVQGDVVHVRLDLVRGNWKLDQVALAELGAPVTPEVLDPVSVTHDGRPAPDALAKLVDPHRYLVTYPGDAYTLHFALPEGDNELFLESRGYYYEWIREDWLKEESAFEVLRILLDPKGAMRRLAPKYKRIEGDMERVFWNSRFGGGR
jgi:hypothetical protein